MSKPQQISVTRIALNLDNKDKGINLCDDGKRCSVVAKEMGFDSTQIMDILKRKHILHHFDNDVLSNRKHSSRVTSNDNLNY